MKILDNTPRLDRKNKIIPAPEPRFNDEVSVHPLPLENSHEVDGVEHDIKRLAIDVFAMMSVDLHDTNVMAMPYLASEEYIRKAMSRDGLVLIENIRDPWVLRDLYVAWLNQTGRQKRGLFFLRKYMQALYGEHATIEQLWLDERKYYPSEIHGLNDVVIWWRYKLNEEGRRLDGSWRFNGHDLSAARKEEKRQHDEYAYLSSRVRISLSFDSGSEHPERLRRVFSNIVSARFTPEFVLWSPVTIGEGMRAESDIQISIDADIISSKEHFLHRVSDPHEFEVTDPEQIRISYSSEEISVIIEP